MKNGRTVFAQLMDFIPSYEFRQCVERYNGNYKVKSFSCRDQFLCMAFAQLTYRESLRDIEACLRVAMAKLYHMGIRGKVSRNTLAHANETRDWRIYADFACLYRIHQSQAFFVTRAKSNFVFKRLYSKPVDKAMGVRVDQIVNVAGFYSLKDYPEKLRRICYRDAETDKRLVFLTNNFNLPAPVIAQLYKCRWQVELFFKWIKQHLRIKAFYGTTENAVKTQIWIAISVYVLVAIIKKRLKLDRSLYTILQILSVTLFEKNPILQTLSHVDSDEKTGDNDNQLNLFL